jgi:hypothetical protein
MKYVVILISSNSGLPEVYTFDAETSKQADGKVKDFRELTTPEYSSASILTERQAKKFFTAFQTAVNLPLNKVLKDLGWQNLKDWKAGKPATHV